MANPLRRVAVVGAGPAGFYAAGQLLTAGFEVDLLDALPTPFGLVRSGVAPDHPKIKAVSRVFDKIAQHPGFRFFGGVVLGEHIAPVELVERYHAVLYAFGTPTDKRLGIPGEDLPGSHSATDFVAWYNGHPHHADDAYDLSVRRAVVVGNGNVAVDVARMLALRPDELAVTDTARHAIEALSTSAISEVVLLGRRGPAQAAFTNPELLELGELSRADVLVDPADVEGVDAPEGAPATNRRNVEILRDYARRKSVGKPLRVALKFFHSPVEIVGQNRVEGVRVVRNEIDADGRAVPSGEEHLIGCGLVIRSIGYRGIPLEGIPFDDRGGVIRNEDGRVIDDRGVRVGEYATGWIKRGPTGVIGTNKKDSAETTANIVHDAERGLLDRHGADAPGECEAFFRERAPSLVCWDGWRLIDAYETEAGKRDGRPRVKVVSIERMAEIADPSWQPGVRAAVPVQSTGSSLTSTSTR